MAENAETRPSPLSIIKADNRNMVTMKYEEVSRIELLEQARMIF